MGREDAELEATAIPPDGHSWLRRSKPVHPMGSDSAALEATATPPDGHSWLRMSKPVHPTGRV
eukprot:CAMPEP_0173243240 /NCGR_PEP_ID=MMETSP1142-20121109/15391_1 /TAXON_ID=483371 /ORGANISM="non described non described, Strain CCMP2298" /LENGTH=62 /DNA_ID=CAMNT_0014174809 /DNA_START=162 /DNA_END=350 /DNA_ORIENTATION=+